MTWATPAPDQLGYAARVRSVLALALVSACGFSVPARDDAGGMPDTPPDVPTVTWTVDPTSGKAVPANQFEWRDFLKAKGLTSIMTPNGLWLAQEGSGPLADSIGPVALAPIGATLYGLTVPGWSRKAVGTTDGSVASFSNMTDATLPNVGSTSMTVLALIAFPGIAPANTRTFLVEGSGSLTAFAQANLDSSKHLMMTISPTTTTGAQDPGTAATAVMMKLDHLHAEQKLFTSTEKITLPNTPLVGSRGLFLGGAVAPAPETRFLYVVAWYGSRAEISDADVTALLTALDW